MLTYSKAAQTFPQLLRPASTVEAADVDEVEQGPLQTKT